MVFEKLAKFAGVSTRVVSRAYISGKRRGYWRNPKEFTKMFLSKRYVISADENGEVEEVSEVSPTSVFVEFHQDGSFDVWNGTPGAEDSEKIGSYTSDDDVYAVVGDMLGWWDESEEIPELPSAEESTPVSSSRRISRKRTIRRSLSRRRIFSRKRLIARRIPLRKRTSRR